MTSFSLLDAGFGLAALIALVSGVLSFLSPCVLPVVPPYLAYMGGISMGELTGASGRRRPVVVPALFFVLGLSTVFLFMGFAASAFGRAFLQFQPVMTKVSGAVVVILGLHFLHVLRIPLLDREARLEAGDRGGSALGAYVLGLAFAFGWTPCIGPQLGAILSLAASEASLARGTVLLAIYALGLGIPFLLAAVFITRSLALMGRLKRHMGLIEKAMGLLLILVGVALLTGAFSRFAYWLLETFPGLGLLG
ncbi:MAG: cytochrome c biogenesis protein CcdA [Proteobacteria bacterium]|nr:cytochrome c biogenesis protein CcdA [Pseudomonadota bacterium]MBS0573677.1 cytochrome c biogenesis protein CcdA [Pseudomonadota bacterium]